ncbi:MAG TPA: HAD family phosphatase [Candidatus Enterocloster excrementipullorum]|uniref:HAD family phosphatase n=1 Tax=Candidatus Enterocloster excrementipullorum TaxID=2838559 RepID=A0A9D2MYN1_9FIRM|nr:HAD family phosphatase [Candidatus Enterocloster excrementipullorum]
MMKALIFDMDGVIIDSEPGSMEQILAFVRSKRPEVTRKELYQIVGRTSRDVWTRIAGVIGWDKDWLATRTEYREVWQPAHPHTVNYHEIFRPAALDILKWAREKGMRTAVASSTAYEKVKTILTQVGVAPYLDVIVSGEQFKESKPNPEIYLKTAQLLGALPKECIAIEDSTVGITAAHRAGVKVIALRDDRFDFDRSLADGEIGALEEFIGLYEREEGCRP